MNTSIRIWIIVPCYNEEKRLPVNEFNKFLLERSSDIHILFVNDGSNDKTNVLIDGISKEFPEQVNCLHLNNNVGKAEAIRQGVHHLMNENIDCEYLGFMDADLSTPITEIDKMKEAIERFSRPSMVIGSRIKLFGSTNITRSNRRHYVGRIIATFISKSLKLPIYDTQCGFKFIRKDRLEILFKDPFISRWLFDVELIFRLLKLVGYQAIEVELFEIPVSKWEEKGDSKIPLSYAFRMPFELLKIRSRYRM